MKIFSMIVIDVIDWINQILAAQQYTILKNNKFKQFVKNKSLHQDVKSLINNWHLRWAQGLKVS